MMVVSHDSLPVHPLSDTDYAYAAVILRPARAVWNTFPILAELVALVCVTDGQEHRLPFSAWGKHERDARANLETKLRQWIADPTQDIP